MVGQYNVQAGMHVARQDPVWVGGGSLTILGNCGGVGVSGNGKLWYASLFLGKWQTSFFELLAPEPGGLFDRYQHETVVSVSTCSLDFSYLPQAVTVSGNMTIIGGGFVTYYNGLESLELGFHTAPYVRDIDTNTWGEGVALPDSTEYYNQNYWEHYDLAGILHRGPPSPKHSVTTGVTTNENTLEPLIFSYPLTWRDMTRMNCHVHMEEAAGNTPMSSAMKSNQIIQNSFSDQFIEQPEFRDAGIWEEYKNQLYTNGGELEAVAPEGFGLVTVAMDRVFFGDAWRRNRFQFTKPFVAPTAAETQRAPETNEGFGGAIPREDDMTALAEMDDKVIMWTKENIYMLSGSGPDDAGAGAFPPLQMISSDSGCERARSVVECREGCYYQSQDGLYLLSRGGETLYVGDQIEALLEAFPVITSGVRFPDKQLVLWTCQNTAGTNSIILVYDYQSKRWYDWRPTAAGGGSPVYVGACYHDGSYYVQTVDGDIYTYDENSFYDGVDGDDYWVEYRVKMGWFAPAPQGWFSIRLLQLLWEAIDDDCTITVDLFRDYATTAWQTETISQATMASYEDAAQRAQVRIKPTIQKMQAFTFELYDSAGASTTGRGPSLLGILYDVAQRPGTAKMKKEHNQ
jgi:hypothetical protein